MHLVIFALFGLFAFSQGCTELTVSPGVEASLNSHARYGEERYENDVSRCWILRADPGYVIKVWTEDLRLEEDEDYLNVYCGADGAEGLLGRFTGEWGTERALFSNGPSLYVNFETDGSTRMAGFMLNYMAVEAQEAPEGNCMDSDEYEDSHEDDDDSDDSSDESHERHRSDSDESDSDESDSDESDSDERDSDESDSDESDSDESDESWESDEFDDVEDIVVGVVVMVFVIALVAGCVACFAISLRARQRLFAPNVNRNMTSQGVYTSFNNPLAEKPTANEVV